MFFFDDDDDDDEDDDDDDDDDDDEVSLNFIEFLDVPLFAFHKSCPRNGCGLLWHSYWAWIKVGSLPLRDSHDLKYSAAVQYPWWHQRKIEIQWWQLLWHMRFRCDRLS